MGAVSVMRGPKVQTDSRCDPLGDFEAGEVRMLVDKIADEGVDIRSAQSLDDLQPRPPRAKEEVVEKAERDRVNAWSKVTLPGGIESRLPRNDDP